MKKFFTLALSLIVYGVSNSQPVLAKWTFEAVTTTNTGTTANVSAGSAQADVGVKATGSSFTGVHASAATVWSNPAGNGSAKSVSSNTWAVGDYYQFQLSTTGYTGISVTYDQTGSNTGPAQFKLQYSTDGTNFTDFQSYTIPNNAGAAYSWSSSTPITNTTFTFDLSGIAALNNAANVYFRVVDAGTTSINNTTVATGGTGRIDNFTVSGFTIFPLSLVSFNATLNNSSVSLSWSTVNELDIAGFIVERSVNGKDFSAISSHGAKGAVTTNDYSLTDAKAVAGISYYRLKVLDKDGSFKYSQVQVIKTKAMGLSVYPNPVKSNITLQHAVADKGTVISILDLNGKQVLTVKATPGEMQTNIDAAMLKPGSYVVVYDNNGVRFTKQFVKQ